MHQQVHTKASARKIGTAVKSTKNRTSRTIVADNSICSPFTTVCLAADRLLVRQALYGVTDPLFTVATLRRQAPGQEKDAGTSTLRQASVQTTVTRHAEWMHRHTCRLQKYQPFLPQLPLLLPQRPLLVLPVLPIPVACRIDPFLCNTDLALNLRDELCIILRSGHTALKTRSS